jgi:hypothetical protein
MSIKTTNNTLTYSKMTKFSAELKAKDIREAVMPENGGNMTFTKSMSWSTGGYVKASEL